ncbi:MAG: SPASM domain-containing protein [Candidatus Electrothrix sp. AU1_5]|nr:SPASM domain-containing protein [Candidatus Electrothrix gigas]
MSDHCQNIQQAEGGSESTARQKKPYHLFQYRDNKYAIHIDSSSVIRLDDPGYDALSFLLKHDTPDEMGAFLSQKYDEATVQSVVQEIGVLKANGFFFEPAVRYDEEQQKKYLERYSKLPSQSITLFLAEKCNLQCGYCFVRENKVLDHGQLMSWDVAKQSIDFAFRRAENIDNVNIVFFGGEPLLNKKVLYKAVAYGEELAQQQGKEVNYSMTTNATLMDTEMIQYIIQHKIAVLISLDGAKEVHDSIRPFANSQASSHDVTVKNIQELMKQGSAVSVRCTISSRYLDRIEQYRFFRDLGVAKIIMEPCVGTSEHNSPFDVEEPENATLQKQDDYFLDKILEQLGRKEQVLYNPWDFLLMHIHYKERQMPCSAGRDNASVSVDGKLYPCPRYVGMDEYILGDIWTGLDQEKYESYLSGYLHTTKKCENCWAVNFCTGYCPWLVSLDNGEFREPLNWWCDNLLKKYEQAAWLYDMIRTDYPHCIGSIK